MEQDEGEDDEKEGMESSETNPGEWAREFRKEQLQQQQLEELAGNSMMGASSTSASSSTMSDATQGGFFNPMISANEEMPQWIVDADKAARKKKALAGKKKKKITDDWRFWAAIVATAGFASAAYSVWQQTGGFDGGVGESWGGGATGIGGGVGGEELII